jgi:hypothetical protein
MRRIIPLCEASTNCRGGHAWHVFRAGRASLRQIFPKSERNTGNVDDNNASTDLGHEPSTGPLESSLSERELRIFDLLLPSDLQGHVKQAGVEAIMEEDFLSVRYLGILDIMQPQMDRFVVAFEKEVDYSNCPSKFSSPELCYPNPQETPSQITKPCFTCTSVSIY